MSTLPKVTSKEAEMTSLESHKKIPSKKLPVKNIFSNMQTPVITDPIDPKRISKVFLTNSLSVSSVVKAGLVFFATVGSYYLAKTTGIFSYLKWGTRNSKGVDNSEIMEVKNAKKSLSVKTNLETARQVVTNPLISQTVTARKDRTIKFEEIKVEKFKDLPEVKEKNVKEKRSVGRRSISVQNPIPNQNAIVEKFFELTIDGTNVFSSSSALFLEAPNIPTWLNFLLLNPNPTFKGSYDTPGYAYDITLSGNCAYVADEASGLQIIDISDPSNPIFKSSYDTPDRAMRVALSDSYAYVTDGPSFQIIDISDPSNPTFKGSYDTPDEAIGVAVSGNYAYVVEDWSGLKIIDISDPSNPTFKGSYYIIFDTSREVALSGNYAYVAHTNLGLQIIDITDPSNPTFKGSYDTVGDAWGVAVSGNYAYVAYPSSGLQIIDITDPANPTFKGSYNTPDNAWGVTLSGDYAYVADGGYNYSSGLQIIDVSDPSNPTFKGSYDTPDRAMRVALSNTYAYVADDASGLQIIALNLDKLILSGTPSSLGTYGVDIEACNEAAECATDSFDITVGNNPPTVENQIPDQIVKVNDIFAFSASSVFQDPDGHALTLSSSLQNNNPLPSWLQFSTNYLFGIPTSSEILSLKVTADDNYGGIVTDQFTLTVQNLLPPSISTGVTDKKASKNKLLEFEVDTNKIFTSPESKPLVIEAMQAGKTVLPNWLSVVNLNPELEGTFATTGATKDLVINDKSAYLADNSQGLEIVDISNPKEIEVIGSYATNAALDIAKSGNLVFVADGSNGLKILDVRDPSIPRLRGNYSSGHSANAVTVSGKHALVADGNNGLLVLDVSTPIPTLKSKYDGTALDVKTVDNYAYLAAGISGLEIIDITDPTTPTLKGSYQNAISVNSLAISGNYCYLANDNAGLKILDISNPNLPSVIGSIDTVGIARGVSVSGKEVYVASDSGGIQIIDIKDPTNPTVKSSLDTTGTALKIEKSGNFLYIADGESGMKVVNVGKIKFTGTPTQNDVGTITIELKANDGTNEVTDTFTIKVEENVLEDLELFFTSVAGWVSISVAGTACVCLTGAALILLTSIAVCCKKAKAKKHRARLRENFTDIELEIDDKEYKHKEREIAINESAKAIEKAVDLSDRDEIVKNCAKLTEEAKSIGKELINPGVTATHLANVVRSEQFMHLDRESKLEILKAFEIYTGLALIASATRRQTIYEKVQAELVEQMREVKNITPKNDYEMLFEISCIKEALQIIKSTEKDTFELFKSVFKIQETGELFAGFVKQYRKVTKQWYSKLVSMRYMSYAAQKEKEELDNLQELMPEQGSWQLIYGVVKMLGRIALEGGTSEIREQAYFGKDEKMGLKDYIGYSKGKEKGQRAIRGEVAKVLYRLSQQDSSSKLEDRESQIIAATEALEKRQNVEKDAEVKKVLKRLEKDWDKEERKKRLVVKELTEEVTTSPTQKTPPEL
jgi:hypothetical protein